MKLIISERVVEEISVFARKYGGQESVLDDFKITVRLSIFSISFFQPERYSQFVACYFDFGGDIGFFFEDVVLAINGKKDAHQVAPDEDLVNVDVKARNDNYIHQVLEYCEKNIDIITSMPPSWFLRAVNISYAAIRENFPALADEDLRKKQELWESWQR